MNRREREIMRGLSKGAVKPTSNGFMSDNYGRKTQLSKILLTGL